MWSGPLHMDCYDPTNVVDAGIHHNISKSDIHIWAEISVKIVAKGRIDHWTQEETVRHLKMMTQLYSVLGCR